MIRSLRLMLAALVVLALLPILPRSPLAPHSARAAVTTFSSSGGLTVGAGAASPYPSTITVSGLSGTV